MSYRKNSTLKQVKKSRPLTPQQLQRLREFHDTIKAMQDEQFTGDQHSVRKYDYKKPREDSYPETLQN